MAVFVKIYSWPSNPLAVALWFLFPIYPALLNASWLARLIKPASVHTCTHAHMHQCLGGAARSNKRCMARRAAVCLFAGDARPLWIISSKQEHEFWQTRFTPACTRVLPGAVWFIRVKLLMSGSLPPPPHGTKLLRRPSLSPDKCTLSASAHSDTSSPFCLLVTVCVY